MKLSSIQIALLAAALACSAPVSAYTLDGKGFDVSYTGLAGDLTLSSDGTSILFGSLKASGRASSANDFSAFSITLDSGYTFSSLLLSASGTYSGGASTHGAILFSTVSAEGVGTLVDASAFLGNGSSSSRTWSVSNAYQLASTSFANASSLDLTSLLSIGNTKAGVISATSYSLNVATSAITVTPSVPAVPAVPEPGEWAMMLAGLGMISTIVLRRAQRS